MVAVTKAATALRTGLKETPTNQPRNGRLAVFKTAEMMLARPPMADCKMRGDRAGLRVPPPSTCAPLKPPFKSSCPLIISRELAFGHESGFSPGCQPMK